MIEKLLLTPRQRRERLRYCKRRKQRFLTTLADTYDEDSACDAAGLDWAGLCALRALDPAFAAAWDAVIAAGYARVETRLLKEAGAGGGTLDVALARELLKQRGAATARKPGAGAKSPPLPPRDRDKSIADFMRHFRDPGAPRQAKDEYGPDRELAAVAARIEGGRGSSDRAAAAIAG